MPKPDDVGDVALWPSRENYARFRAVCDDTVPETFDEFEAIANARIAALAEQGVQIRKVAFSPDRMATWCRTNFGKVDAHTRRLYAAVAALEN